jgi:ATP-binding cassette subfamily B protein
MTSTPDTLRQLIRGERLRYAAALAALSVAVALSYVPALVSGAAIDRLSGGTGEASAFARFSQTWPAAAEALAGSVWRAAAAIVVFTALSGAFLYLERRWAAQASERLALRLRERLYDHLQRLPCRYHDRADAGDLVQRCSSDVETVRTFLATQVVEVGRSVLLVGLALPVMLWLNVRMTLVTLALFPPIAVLAVVFFRRVSEKFLAADEAEAEMTSVLQENLTGIRVVRAFARQDHEIGRFAVANARFRDLTEELLALLARYWAVSDFLCLGQVGVVLLVGGAWIRSGELTVGTLFTFMSWANLLVWPVRHAGRVLSESIKAIVSLGRIREVLDEEPETDVVSSAVASSPEPEPEPSRGEVVVRGLTFAHAGGEPVLHDVSFRAEPGETVALVGPPGAGKTTILSLLLRLYDHEQGEILVDGREVRSLPRGQARRLVAAVLQEPFLFSRTVEENIRLAAPQAARQDVEEAARAACVHDSIDAFADGYDTLVGERGVTLSGGQRQRVALARALLEEAPVLVLDDALSAVDTETEAAIVDALRRRHGRRTTLVAAHRLSTVREADRIVVLDRGRVVECGRHEDLLARDGAYRRLWAVQARQEDELRSDLRAAGAADRGGMR